MGGSIWCLLLCGTVLSVLLTHQGVQAGRKRKYWGSGQPSDDPHGTRHTDVSRGTYGRRGEHESPQTPSSPVRQPSLHARRGRKHQHSDQPARPTSNKKRSKLPNIIVFLTDDQDVELGSMDYMPKTLRIMRDAGAFFPNAFVTTPMCCPSRSTLLTGLYVHNHNVYTNNDNCSSSEWQRTHETRNFGVYLANAGYRTGYFGKYLNDYDGERIPPGWTEWVGLIRNSRFYNYSINFNGKKIKHYDNYYLDYLTDLIANDSVTFMKQSKEFFPNRPVAMVLSMPAPHGPEDSAPQYQHLYTNVTTHRTPSWDFAPNPDKQWLLQYTGKMEPIHIAFTDMLHRKRLQTLQSVDDAVEKVYNELRNLGELDNTYMMFLSDHGYHLGQFGILKGKALPYEFDIKVPFFLRGPNIPRGIIVQNIVTNVDVAPTLLDMAKVQVPEHMDGRSVMELFDDPYESSSVVGGVMKRKKAWKDTFLVERGKLTPQKLSLRDEIDSQRNNLIITKQQRLQLECQKAEYKPPCKGSQQWECQRNEQGKLRIHKCRYGKGVNEAGPTAQCKCPQMKLGRTEKKLQRQFLKDHVNQPKILKPKFIRTKRSVSPLQPVLETGNDDHVSRDTDVDLSSDVAAVESPFVPDSTDHQPEPNPGSMVQNPDLLAVDPGESRAPEYDHNDHPPHNQTEPDLMESPMPEQSDEDIIARPPSGDNTRDQSHTEQQRRQDQRMLSQNKTLDPDMDPDVRDMLAVDARDVPRSEIQDPPAREHNLPEQVVVSDLGASQVNEDPVPVSCRVLPNTSVVCEKEVYESSASWKAQRERLDTMIQQLKQQLDHLKDVKKHLRSQKPDFISDEYANYEDSEEDSSEQDSSPQEHISPSKYPTGPPQPPASGFAAGFPNVGRPPEGGQYNGTDIDELFEEFAEETDTDPDPNCLCEEQAAPMSSDVPLLSPREQLMIERRERKKQRRQHRREQKKAEKQEKRDEKWRRKMRKYPDLKDILEPTRDCKNNQMKCFSHSNTHWKTPPLWNPVGKKISERKDPMCQVPGMECARMDNGHWKTRPSWTLGPFCFCPNSNNNTYWCLRTINDTHNFLYCEFITGFISYYNMMHDPYQLRNAVHDLSYPILHQLQSTLEKLKGCKGSRECTVRYRPPGDDDLQNELPDGSVGFEGSGDSAEDMPTLSDNHPPTNSGSHGNTFTNEVETSGDGDYDPRKEEFLFLTNVLRLDSPRT